MSIRFELPPEIEQGLRTGFAEPLEQVARESLIGEAYRRDAISVGKVAELLGLPSRFEAEKWLAQRGIGMNYGQSELEQDRTTMDRLFGKAG